MQIPESARIIAVKKEYLRPSNGWWYVAVTYAWKLKGAKYEQSKEHRFKTEAAAIKFRQRAEC
jgi:hypothetical protein